MSAKQVLVMKKFPKGLRTGKYIAQGAHASLGSVLSLGKIVDDEFVIPLSNPFVYEWITGNFRKITCYVESDDELLEVYQNARMAGLACSLIKDAGLTEFKEPTLTAVGIGPDNENLINTITGHLPLF
jgi:PTH2 family peptidyl-tRNA hydrolase